MFERFYQQLAEKNPHLTDIPLTQTDIDAAYNAITGKVNATKTNEYRTEQRVLKRNQIKSSLLSGYRDKNQASPVINDPRNSSE